MRIKDILRETKRTREEPFGADAMGLFRMRMRLPTLTVTEGLVEDLSRIVERSARREVNKVVRRWKEKKEAMGHQFTGDEGDALITYYNEMRKVMAPSYRLIVSSGGMEMVLRAETFTRLKERWSSAEQGRTKEFDAEFTSRDLHIRLELRDSLILRPSLTIGGKDKKGVLSLLKAVLTCLMGHKNSNGFMNNPISFLAFPLVLGFLLLNAVFRCLGGVSLASAFLFGLFLNVPLFLLIVFLIRGGFPLVEFKLTREEVGKANLLRVSFFLASLGIVLFSLMTRFL